MATWVWPTDSSTDPDAPLTSEVAKRWDNNVIAAFEGDDTAVGIGLRLKALQTLNVGSVLRSHDGTEYSGFGLVDRTMFTFLQRGNVRFAASAKVSGSTLPSGTLTFYLVRNQTTYAAASFDIGTSYSRHSTDIYIEPGDTVYARTVHARGGSYTAYLIDVDVYTGGVNLYPNGPGLRVSNDYS